MENPSPNTMTPVRGEQEQDVEGEELRRQNSQRRAYTGSHASEGRSFTVRGILVGLGVGLIICFSNMYFGLQTGWVSGMAMPSALIGYAFFKSLSQHLDLPFTPVENVLVQTVAGSMGTMPLGCGFVGVMPAMNYLMTSKENGPVFLGTWRLILWALGLCFFGVVFAVPLRKQVIIREKLKFPSGTATALMIGVLHGRETSADGPFTQHESSNVHVDRYSADIARKVPSSDWQAKIKLLLMSFAISALYTLTTYFLPVLRKLPVFGYTLATEWLWTLNPSLGYVGQGIIMGPTITTHMLLGAIVGWAILSPLSKHRGWAPGPIHDWQSGSKGWIVWISLAIMLADSVVNLGYIVIRPLYLNGPHYIAEMRVALQQKSWKDLLSLSSSTGYAPVAGGEDLQATWNGDDTPAGAHDSTASSRIHSKHLSKPDAPPKHLVNNSTVWIGLILSILFCVITIHLIFGWLVPLYASITAVIMALLLSLMGVRAMGETDLNPVSGISKLAQLFFALIIPQSNKSSVLINLIAGAISESGALQAGDLMQDLKAGHLLGAAPNAQFWGQIIGSGVGAVVSAFVYKLYTNVYEVPGEQFQVPTAYVWIFTARLVTGQGLPTMASQWALGAAAIFAFTTALKIYLAGGRYNRWVPGGIAVAVGMFNVPSFTLARAIGGFVNLYWRSSLGREETPIVILASGFILGEGVVSIVKLILASLRVPHL